MKHGLYATRLLPGEAEVLQSIQQSIGSLENEAVLARLLLHRVVQVLDTDRISSDGGIGFLAIADRLLGRIVRIEEAREGLKLEEIERLKSRLMEATHRLEQRLVSIDRVSLPSRRQEPNVA